MKTIRRMTTLVGLFVGLLVLSTVGAKGQILDTPHFTGTFTLPFDARWGKMTLPAGGYTLRYGLYYGLSLVEVRSAEKGGLHGVIRVEGNGQSSARKSALVCIREGNGLVIRALEMPQISTAANFALPRGAQLTAHRHNGSKNIQLAQGPTLIQRIPVSLTTK
jgi:hypothetical protein